jgi:hypothetical protein
MKVEQLHHSDLAILNNKAFACIEGIMYEASVSHTSVPLTLRDLDWKPVDYKKLTGQEANICDLILRNYFEQ